MVFVEYLLLVSTRRRFSSSPSFSLDICVCSFSPQNMQKEIVHVRLRTLMGTQFRLSGNRIERVCECTSACAHAPTTENCLFPCSAILFAIFGRNSIL